MTASASSAGSSRRPGSPQEIDAEAPALSPAEAWTALLDGKTVLELADGLELRRVTVMGEYRVELSGFTDGMVDRLKAMGLISEIIAWRLRLFVPTGAIAVRRSSARSSTAIRSSRITSRAAA